VREQVGTPIAPRFLSPGGVSPVAGTALFLIDRHRKVYLKYLGQRALPPRKWLLENYGDNSYPRLLHRHWQSLLELRRRVRNNARRG
jgi:hypothetical protein